jgi:hypothetical protein
MKTAITIATLIISATSLVNCAPLVVGGIAGVAVYHHECYRWIDTPIGKQRVWVCKGQP